MHIPTLKLKPLLKGALSLVFTISSLALAGTNENQVDHPFYVGVLGGYGSTDWSALTPNCSGTSDPDICQQNITLAVPVSAGDTGLTYGVVVGYDIQPHFAIELNYIHFPDTPITMNLAINYPDNLENGTFKSKTSALDALAKFMVQIYHTHARGFAMAGMAVEHRSDVFTKTSRINPVFGFGVDYTFLKHGFIEGQFQYIPGYDKSNTTPVFYYIPFLYSIHAVIGYRF